MEIRGIEDNKDKRLAAPILEAYVYKIDLNLFFKFWVKCYF